MVPYEIVRQNIFSVAFGTLFLCLWDPDNVLVTSASMVPSCPLV